MLRDDLIKVFGAQIAANDGLRGAKMVVHVVPHRPAKPFGDGHLEPLPERREFLEREVVPSSQGAVFRSDIVVA